MSDDTTYNTTNSLSNEAAAAEVDAEVDPILTNDLADVSPDTPLIPKDEYVMEISAVKQSVSERSGNKMLNIQLKTTAPITAVSGEILPQGQTFFHRIMLTPTEKLSTESIKRSLKRFQLACGIKSGPIMPFDQYINKNVRVKVGFSKKTEEYPDDRNEVKDFVID